MALILISLAVVAYALVSKRLASTPVTGALIFMVLGVLLGPTAFDVIHGAGDRHAFELLLEATLAVVLFTDSLAISAGDWRAKSRLPRRLLLIGMPLTMLLGWAFGVILFPDLDVWEVALVAICLAPTDAALGQAVVTSPKVPALIRQALNIESGLNDGLALPFFVLALAAAVETADPAAPGLVEVFVRSLVLAAVLGGVVGWLGARALGYCRERGWVGREWGQIATLALVVLAFVLADTAEGSGFIATWVAGVTFGRTMKDRMPEAPLLAEDLGGLLAVVSFLGFGAMLLGPILDDLTWQPVVYAVLSLTLVRMLPVGLSLLGVGLARPTIVVRGVVRSARARVHRVRVVGSRGGTCGWLVRPAGGVRDRGPERGAPRGHRRLGRRSLRRLVRAREGCRRLPPRGRGRGGASGPASAPQPRRSPGALRRMMTVPGSSDQRRGSDHRPTRRYRVRAPSEPRSPPRRPRSS